MVCFLKIVRGAIENEAQETAFCSYPHAPAGIRAQAFFFAEHRLFAAAYDWCAAILPVTRFR